MTTRGPRKAARLLNLAAHLAAGPRTAADLARQLAFSHRTLQRDLEELPELGHAIERRGRHYHLVSTWSIVAGPRLDVRLRFRHDITHRVQARHQRNLRIDATTNDGALLATVTCGHDKHGLAIDLLPWLLGIGAGVNALRSGNGRAAW